MPTGSGKTITMIQDAISSMSSTDQTIVIVAPTIALTQQLSREFLEFIDGVNVMHVHSGHTRHFTTTNHKDIWGWCQFTYGHKLIFTTYHSLHRLTEAQISIDTIYFDESHNSIQSQWYSVVKDITNNVPRCYFFTASPKYSQTPDKPGMNDVSVYGETICDIPTTQMIDNGYIVPPVFHTMVSDDVVEGKYDGEIDVKNLINCVETHNLNTALISCKNATQLYYITNSPLFNTYCVENQYTHYSITSRYGCFINDKKVSREVMFRHMRSNKGKFILFHIMTCCEGINLPKLEGIVLLKKLSTIKLVQSIGRVLRLADGKTEGKVILPMFSKYLKKTHKGVVNLMNRVYEEGETPVEYIKR